MNKIFKKTGDGVARIIASVALVGVVCLLVFGFCGGLLGSAAQSISTIVKEKIGYSVINNEDSYKAVSSISPENICIVAGVIRNTGEGWQFIENEKHGVYNCTGVSVNEDKGSINIEYSGIKAKKVISFIVSPDETFSSLGYTCGASVGLDHAEVYVHKSTSGLITEVNPEKLTSDSGNFWFIGVFEV